MMVTIRHAESPAELNDCFPTVHQLRPQLRDARDWCARVLSMRPDGYRVLVCLSEAGDVIALAGYRIQSNLIHGRFLFVNDLVTQDTHRGQGLGARLLRELEKLAVMQNCDRMVLDTAMANLAARRFYAREGMAEVIAGFVKVIERAA